MFNKETKRWLRALEIAKILFEDQGYHIRYLEEIEHFLRRNLMYSPKINEELIPILYKLASSRRIPMTKLVNQIIQGYLVETEAVHERESERCFTEHSTEV